MEIASAAVPSDGRDVKNEAGPSDSSSTTASSSSGNPDLIEKDGASSSPPSMSVVAAAAARYDDDEDEEDVCRICRNPGDAENPLRYPCACSGSIKFVHQDCLLQWLNHSNARQCEVCKHPFSFSPVYAENAPARLPFREFIMGMAMKACHVMQFFLRLSFVLSVWLLIIPFITFWIWRLAFLRSFGEAQRLFLSHISTTVILTDCLHGFLLSASIVFIFLGATSLRDYFRHLREIGGQEVDREEEADRNGARVPRRPLVQGNRNFAGEPNVEDVGGAQGIAGAGQIIRRNAENVAARWEMQAARLEAHVEQMFDGLEDADGAEDVPFDELVGMQGPVFHLVENAFTVLASNMIFLGVVIFVPFSLGRVILHYISWLFSSASGPVLSFILPLTESDLSLANITLKNALTAVTNLTSEAQDGGILDPVVHALEVNASAANEAASNISSSVSADLLKGAGISTSRLSDVTTLAVGYMLIFFLVFLYLGVVALIRYTKGEPLTLGRFYGIASIAETIPSLFRQFLAAMKHLMTMIKVAFLLVIELGVFPLMCGWWLDICTLRMFGKSMSDRIQFFSASPLASSLVHWVVGIVYMLQISIFVSLLRGVLRHGVLYFLRDPADPNYNPFRDLIDDPVHKHGRRVLLSVAVYGSLIVMLVFLPVKLAMRMAPSIFPLDISVSDPFTEIPADMLLFQICIPFAVEHFKLRTTIKSLLCYWFTAVGWALGLTDYLLPRPDENGGQGNAEPGRQDQLQAGAQDRALAVPGVDDHPNRGIPGAGNLNTVDEDDSEDHSDSGRYGFVGSIVLLLVVAWMTLLLFNSAVIVVPVALGRALFNAIPLLPTTHGIKCNDLYAFVIGSYAIWTALAGVRYCLEHVRTKRAAVLFNQVRKWCGIILKSSALLSIWIFIIPVMIGLLFELLVIVPMRVPVDESPVFLLYQDWALGLIFLKIWTRLVMLDHMMPLVDESWRIKFERVREDGFSRLQGLWVLREIVFPIVMKLLTALCVPYVLARGVFPVLGYPLVVNSAVYRFSWLGCLCLSVLCFCAKRFHVWFTNLHNSIRDDRYLIGRRLHNFGEDAVGASEDENDDCAGSSNQEGQQRPDVLLGGGGNEREEGGEVGLRLRNSDIVMDNNPWPRKRSFPQRTINVTANNFGSPVPIVHHEEARNIPAKSGAEPSRIVRNLNEKLASVLLDDHLTKTEHDIPSAELEKAEEDVFMQRQVAHHEPALKQFTRPLSSIPEELEVKMYSESIRDKSSTGFKELENELRDLAIDNTNLSRTLMVKEKLIDDLYKQASQTSAEFHALMSRLDSTEKENAFLKYEFHMLEKEIDVRNEELAYSRQHADASRRQHLESVKTIAKLEAECQRRQKRDPFPATATLKPSHEIPEKNINFLLDKLVATEEENRSLKDTLMRKNAELQSSRIMFSRTASRLSQVEAQLAAELPGGGVKSMELVKYIYPIPGSEFGSDDGVSSSSGSWATALLSELESFRDGKVIKSLRNDHKPIESLEMCLMDDFVEMEKFAVVSTTGDDDDQEFDWLQVVLKALNKQHRVSKRSMPELLEDINIALGYNNHLSTHCGQPSLSKSMCKIVDLVERFKIPVALTSKPEDQDSKELSSSLVVAEPSDVMQKFLHACNSLMDGKTSVEKFTEELSSALEFILSNHNMFGENERLKETEARLKVASEKTESLTIQLQESEQNIRNIKAEMETLREYKYMVEDQMENQISINEELDTQLSVAKAQLNEVMQKYSCLEVELEDKHDCCEELESTCLDLQLQLEGVTCIETTIETTNNGMNGEGKQSSQNELEISAASVKLAECQETILSLGKQLKALASPSEAALFDKVFNAGNAANIVATTTTNNNNRNLFRRFSLRDQMLAEDKSKAIILYSPKEEDALIESPNQHNDYGGGRTPEGDGGKTADTSTAMAIVPGKKSAGFEFLRRLLMRRKKGVSKKSQPMVKA
ncbi:unnamed protein product [Linum trigynum]|uniref:RING-type E3 ubiquitin transferase n=1 Tax=Linum trigynum TaxID=586398 RepID=A0AAV2GIA5_9ROSI